MKIYHDIVFYDRNNKYLRTFNHIHFDYRLTPMARLLFPVIHNWNVRAQLKRQPSINSLAKQFHCSSNTIDAAVKCLKTYGYLTSGGRKENTLWWTHPIPNVDNLEYSPPLKHVRKYKS